MGVHQLRVIVKATGDHYFKIGVTNREVQLRVGQLANPDVIIEPIMIRPFDTGEDARAVEQRILADFSANLVPTCALLKSGNSELFDRDISEHLSGYLPAF